MWDGIICLPIVGIMDTRRSADMTDALLRAVVTARAECAIIDITGIDVMDTGTADHFIRMAKAVQLLGASCVLTGINPQIAQTLVHMGIELTGLVTHRSLREALQYFVGQRTARHTTSALRRRRAGHRVEHAVDAFAARRSGDGAGAGDRVRAARRARAGDRDLGAGREHRRYGIRGDVTVEAVDDQVRGRGIEIIASDCGPPFHDFALAQRDGFSDEGPIDPVYVLGRHGIGAGLGAVVRFTDELTCEPTEDGKKIRAVRYLKRPKKA